MRSARTTPAAHAAPTERPPSGRSEVLVVSSVHLYRRLASELTTGHDAVLEIGCSTGGTTRLLAERAGRVLAVDVAAGLVERLRQMAADPDPRVRRIATRDRAEEARTHD